jgi:3-hydroxyacyl-CoA dehydrogenase
VKAVRAASTAASFAGGEAAERALFAELMGGAQARALQYFFFAERKVGKIPDIPSDTAPTAIKSAG